MAFGKGFGQTLQDAHGGERRHAGAAAADRHGGIRVRPDDGNRPDGGLVERQQAAVVLEEDHSLAGGLQRHLGSLGVVARDGDVRLVPVQPAEAHGRAEDAAHLVVDGRRLDLTLLDRGQELLAVQELARGHLEIEAAVRRPDGVVGGGPVRHHHPVEAPLLLRHVGVEEAVLGHVLAVGQVVGVHDGPHVGLLHRRLEDGKVDLPLGALVDDRIDVVAVELGVVAHEVLDRRADALRLDALDVAHGDARREEGVLPEVLEVPAVHGRPVDVDPGAKEEVNALGARIPPDLGADSSGELGVPGRGEGDPARHGGRRAEVPDAERAVGHLESGKVEARQVADEEAVDSAEEVDLLLEGHLAEDLVDPVLDVGGGLSREGRRGEGEGDEGQDQATKLPHRYSLLPGSRGLDRSGSHGAEPRGLSIGRPLSSGHPRRHSERGQRRHSERGPAVILSAGSVSIRAKNLATGGGRLPDPSA